jgi:hypothetical protein
MPTLTAPRRHADVHLVAQRSLTRASVQHVQVRFVEPGLYRSHSKSGPGWYGVTATRFGRDIIIRCSCKGGIYFRDELGSSACKHAVGLAKRLVRRRDEVKLLSQAAGEEYNAWLDGQRDAMIAEDGLQPAADHRPERGRSVSICRRRSEIGAGALSR